MTEQGDFFGPDLDSAEVSRRVAQARPGLARAGQPQTAWDAAVACAGRAGNQRRRVLAMLSVRGAQGATNIEIEEGLHLMRPSGSNRRYELESHGLCKPVKGRTRPTPAGMPAQIYVITSLGQAVLEHLDGGDHATPDRHLPAHLP